MPINTEAENRYMIFDNVGQTHYFALEFERMPEGKAFNILEDESNPNAYNFYSVLVFPLLGWLRDWHPLDNAHAERTKKKKRLFQSLLWVPGGTRTHDIQNHNLTL